MVADTEAQNIQIMEEIMKDEPDIQVIGVNTKEHLLEILDKQEIHLILLDLNLPDTKGFELCQMLQKKYKIPMILMTVDKSIDTIQKISELGFDDYLAKPLHAFVVKEMVHGIINSWDAM